jgi:hypothetical protein
MLNDFGAGTLRVVDDAIGEWDYVETRDYLWPASKLPEQTPERIIDDLVEIMRCDLKAISSKDPIIRMRGVVALRGLYRVLVETGHTQWEPVLDDLEARFAKFAKALEERRCK